MTKIYKLVIFFQEKKTLTRAFCGKDYACINGELQNVQQQLIINAMKNIL